MRKRNTLIVLALVTAVVVAAAAMVNRQRPVLDTRAGEPLFPDLVTRINDTAEVTAVSGGEAFTLAREDDRWVVPEKSGYPAAADQVRGLLLGTARLRRIEAKTSNPELYAKLDLEDPGAEGAKSVHYTIKDAGGAVLASLIVGKRRSASPDPSTPELYVRLPGDPQAWLVTGKLPAHKTALAWLDKDILKIERDRVRKVTVTHPDGERVVVAKRAPGDRDFVLQDQPEDAKVKSQFTVNNVARTLVDMSLEDVKPAAEVEFDRKGGIVAVLETFDGLRVTVTTVKQGDDHFARLEAAYDASLVAAPPAAEPEAGDEGDKDDKDAEGGGKGEPVRSKVTPEEVEEEVATLNSRWARWAYRIPSYQVEDVAKKVADLVEPKEKTS